jgi:DNA primase
MRGKYSDLDRLRRIPLHQVARALGLTLPKSGSARCPFPDHEDRNPSFYLDTAGNRWCCFGCGRRGSVIDLVMVARGLDFSEAAKWLADFAGGHRSNMSMVQSQTIKQALKPAVVEGPPDVEVYDALLSASPLASSGIAYLASRAISQNTVATFRIGQIGDNRTIARRLVTKFGYERVAAASLLSLRATPDAPTLTFRTDQILIPFFERGRCVYFQSRACGDATEGRWLNLRRRHRLFNVDVLSDASVKRIGICEGVTDSLSAFELGIAPLGLVGASATLPHECAALLRGRQVDIFADNDERGMELGKRLQGQLSKIGVVATRRFLPPGMKDLNEFLKARKCRGASS